MLHGPSVRESVGHVPFACEHARDQVVEEPERHAQSMWPSMSIPSTRSGSGKRERRDGEHPAGVGSARTRTHGMSTPTISAWFEPEAPCPPACCRGTDVRAAARRLRVVGREPPRRRRPSTPAGRPPPGPPAAQWRGRSASLGSGSPPGSPSRPPGRSAVVRRTTSTTRSSSSSSWVDGHEDGCRAESVTGLRVGAGRRSSRGA